MSEIFHALCKSLSGKHFWRLYFWWIGILSAEAAAAAEAAIATATAAITSEVVDIVEPHIALDINAFPSI